MKLHQLRDAIAVADTGSLRAAARQLNIAQSAITKSVQMLERELDVPLFERNKRGAVLTPMGELFVQRARAAAGELTRAQEEINQHRGMGLGQVTFSLSTVPQIALLPMVIAPYRQRYPDVRLTLVEALGFHSVEAQMRSGAVDAYVGVAPLKNLGTEYLVEPLFANRRLVVCRKGHPLAGARSLHELSNASWVVSSLNSADASLAALFRKHQCKEPTKMTFVGNVLSQLVLLLNSDMLMIAPQQVTEFEPYRGRIASIPVKEAIPAPTLVMVRRVALPLTPAAEHFWDLMRRAGVHVQKQLAASSATSSLTPA